MSPHPPHAREEPEDLQDVRARFPVLVGDQFPNRLRRSKLLHVGGDEPHSETGGGCAKSHVNVVGDDPGGKPVDEPPPHQVAGARHDRCAAGGGFPQPNSVRDLPVQRFPGVRLRGPHGDTGGAAARRGLGVPHEPSESIAGHSGVGVGHENPFAPAPRKGEIQLGGFVGHACPKKSEPRIAAEGSFRDSSGRVAGIPVDDPECDPAGGIVQGPEILDLSRDEELFILNRDDHVDERFAGRPG